MKRLTDAVFALLAITLLATSPAHAYLDPTSISMALQVVIGAAAAGLIAVKLYFGKIIGFFRHFKKRDSDKR